MEVFIPILALIGGLTLLGGLFVFASFTLDWFEGVNQTVDEKYLYKFSWDECSLLRSEVHNMKKQLKELSIFVHSKGKKK